MKNNICIPILIFVLFFTINESFAQSPACKWAKSAIGDYYDKATSVITDNSGNVFITGHFYSTTLTFDSITLINNGPNGSYDILLAKFNSNGDILWAKNFGNTSFDIANSIAIDSMGNVYITGYFMGETILFDTIAITSNGWREVYLAKFNSEGDVIWAKSAGGTRNDEANSITVDNSGNIYLTGKYGSPVIYFNSDSLVNTSSSPSPSNDIFFSKYDPYGNLVWIKNIGGYSHDEAFSVTSDNSSSIFIAGTFKSSVLYFESDSLIKTYDKSDFFLLKYNTSGNVDWVNSGGGNDHDTATSVVVDNWGNVYLGGSFKSPIFFYNGYTLLNANNKPWSNDIFIIKYNPSGEPIWGNSIGSYGDENLTSLTIGTSESLILSGYFNSDYIVIGPNTLFNMGGSDIFLASYNEDGSTNWSKGIGNIDNEFCYSVFNDQYGNLFMAGTFDSPSLTIDSIVLINSNYSDLFVASLNYTPNGINMEEQPSLINIFPNPSSNYISINMPMNSELEILNLNGQVIKKLRADEDYMVIDISCLTKGLYFLKITIDTKIITKKIIKQ